VNRKIFYPQETERLWNVPENAKVIFSPRMLTPFYNQLMMLDILKDVVVSEPQAVLVFATYNQDQAYRDEIEARIGKLGLDDHVFFAPPMNQLEMAQAYNFADLVLSLSPSDGTPVSVMEAMACGTPVVMANLERYKEFFTHRESGWLTPIEPDSVNNALTTLMSDKHLYETLKTNGQKVVEEKADLHSQSRLLEEMSYRLINPS
jgi:glycosyltransferase involved in cell wall biosynthesis